MLREGGRNTAWYSPVSDMGVDVRVNPLPDGARCMVLSCLILRLSVIRTIRHVPDMGVEIRVNPLSDMGVDVRVNVLPDGSRYMVLSCLILRLRLIRAVRSRG